MEKASTLNFSFPIGAAGLSSSWITEADTTNRNMAITVRKQIKLSEVENQPSWHPIENEKAISKYKLLKKNPNGTISGISSGAGSAIVRHDNKYIGIKYKRCGIQYGNCASFPHMHESILTKVTEYGISYISDLEPLGQMWLIDAQHELICQHRLRKIGLSDSYNPLGYFINDKDIGTAVFEISSDVRADEFLLMIVSPILHKLMKEKKAEYIPTTGKITITNISPLQEFVRNKQCMLMIEQLGRAIGGLYSNLYRNGFLRGIGNCWFGNEVIGPDGSLSIVDLDEMVLPEMLNKSTWFLDQQCWEWCALKSTMYTYLELSSCYLLSFPASLVVRAAESGFSEKATPIIARGMIEDIVGEYQIAKDFWEEDGKNS